MVEDLRVQLNNNTMQLEHCFPIFKVSMTSNSILKFPGRV